ncbi:MAG TPA: hypothetical protein VFX59_07330 [Polyangiales bacterium]|nr:hypothetical protein [Polyangiales bacterium]
MSELSPKARALLAAARRNHGPNDDERQRVLAGLHVSLGIAGALPMLTDASPANASATGPQLAQSIPHAPSVPPPPMLPEVLIKPAAFKALGWSKLLAWKAGKVYLATLVIGGSAVGVSMVPRGEDDVSTRRTAAMVAPHEESEGASAPAVVPPALQAPVVEAPVVEAPVVEAAAVELPLLEGAASEVQPPARVAMRREARVSSRSTRVHHDSRRTRVERELLAQNITPAAPDPKPVAPAQDLAAALGVGSSPSPELALIRAALTSLRDRDSAQALRLLDEHAARYPRGAFSTERRALHVVALCAAGRHEEGSRERAQFLESFGESPIAARVRSACPR